MVKYMKWIYKLMILNIVTIVTSIPVVTLGASLAAMFQILGSEEDAIVKPFFTAYVKHLKKSLPLTVGFLVMTTGAVMMRASIWGLLLLVELSAVYLASIQIMTRNHLGIKELVKNGFIMGNHLMGHHLVGLLFAYGILKFGVHVPAIGVFMGISLWGYGYDKLFKSGYFRTLGQLRRLNHENV